MTTNIWNKWWQGYRESVCAPKDTLKDTPYEVQATSHVASSRQRNAMRSIASRRLNDIEARSQVRVLKSRQSPKGAGRLTTLWHLPMPPSSAKHKGAAPRMCGEALLPVSAALGYPSVSALHDHNHNAPPTHCFTALHKANQRHRFNQLHKELMTLLHDRSDTAQRLVNLQKVKHPGQSESWYIDKVIYDLRREA